MSRIPPFKSDHATAGFTLIEVLVALAILGVALMSIGSLVAVNAHGTRALEQHLNLVSIARAIEAGLPDASTSESGPLTGSIEGHRWRVDFHPFTGGLIPKRPSSPWVPETVAITVTAPTGATFRLDTIRLRRGSEQ